MLVQERKQRQLVKTSEKSGQAETKAHEKVEWAANQAGQGRWQEDERKSE